MVLPHSGRYYLPHSSHPSYTAQTACPINFVRPVLQATGRVAAEGQVFHSGKSQAVVEGRLLDANGKLYAMASSTCAILRPQADSPEARAA